MIASILVIVTALLFSAFFSGMEIAFFSANRLRIELDKQKGSISARHIAFFQNNPREYIATMLVGNNVALVIYGIFMGDMLRPYIQVWMQSEIGITLIQTLFSTILILLTAEYLPKSLFRNHPNSTLNIFALPVRLFFILFYPITLLTVFMSDNLLRGLFKIEINEEQEQRVFGKVDLDNLLAETQKHDETETEVNEFKLFQNALEFSDIVVKECMVPRNEIKAIEVNSPVNEIEELFVQTGYSRIPIYEDNIDNIIGYVHHLQLFTRPSNIRSIISAVPIVPATMSIKKLLSKLMAQQKSITSVVDEFGGTAGIITIEDILEEIFGEIEDEHDRGELHEEKVSENEYILSGRLEIDYLNERYKLTLPECDDFETLAGFIFFRHESVPQEGELIKIDNFAIEILKVDNTRIELVKLTIEEEK